MYDTFRYIFIGGLVLSLVCLAASVFIFFFLDIRDAIGDITGSNKRKAVEMANDTKKAKQQKKKTKAKKGEKTSNTSNQLTTRMSIQERYDAMEGAGQTSVLESDSQTAPLTAQTLYTTPPPAAQPKPAAPVQPAQPAAKPQSPNAYRPVAMRDPDFVIETDITFVHSSEVIV